MNAGATAERVYDGLKYRLLSGEFAPGDRLEPAKLAEELVSSVTPVRDALNRLTGEYLVVTRSSEGFHLPILTEAGLRDLYRWQEDILKLALRSSAAPETVDLQNGRDRMRAPPAEVIFALAASLSSSPEHGRQFAACADRLATSRVAEATILDGIETEAQGLLAALHERPLRRLFEMIRGYHARRSRRAGEILSAIYNRSAA